jgi:hypothetical protein
MAVNMCEQSVTERGPTWKSLQRGNTKPKSEPMRLSSLMKWIVINAGDGIDRGEIVSQYFHLERRYCGFFTDPCMKGKEKRDYETRYRRVQPALSRSLLRLQQRGLVELIRHRRYVKEIRLTAMGKQLRDDLLKQAVST